MSWPTDIEYARTILQQLDREAESYGMSKAMRERLTAARAALDVIEMEREKRS